LQRKSQRKNGNIGRTKGEKRPIMTKLKWKTYLKGGGKKNQKPLRGRSFDDLPAIVGRGQWDEFRKKGKKTHRKGRQSAHTTDPKQNFSKRNGFKKRERKGKKLEGYSPKTSTTEGGSRPRKPPWGETRDSWKKTLDPLNLRKPENG